MKERKKVLKFEVDPYYIYIDNQNVRDIYKVLY